MAKNATHKKAAEHDKAVSICDFAIWYKNKREHIFIDYVNSKVAISMMVLLVASPVAALIYFEFKS